MPAARSETGSGVLSTSFGVGVFLTLLFLAAHVLLNLWAISTVDAVAHDAALEVALAPASAERVAVEQQALSRARASLGSYGDEVTLAFVAAGDGAVALHVQAPGLRLLPSLLADGLGVEGVDRTVVVQSETRR